MSVFFLTQKKHVKGLTRSSKTVEGVRVVSTYTRHYEGESSLSSQRTLYISTSHFKTHNTTVYMTSFEERLVCVFVFLCVYLFDHSFSKTSSLA